MNGNGKKTSMGLFNKLRLTTGRCKVSSQNIYIYKCLWVNKMLENSEGAIKKKAIQRNWQQRVHKPKENKTKTQHNMCWTPLYANKYE